MVTDRGTAAVGLRVEAWDKRLKGETLLGKADTDVAGAYLIEYDAGKLAGKKLGDIEVRVLDHSREGGRGREVVRSKVSYQAPNSHKVDLVVAFDATPRADEHSRLLDAIHPHLEDTGVQELGPDGVTYLANRGGYDPRPIAMAASAARASEATGIPADHYYALFRTGAARDLTSAHQLTDARLRSALETAVKSGVIADDGSIDATLDHHARLARAAFRSYIPPGGTSTLDDLLGVRLDEEEKDVFVDALRAVDSNGGGSLWERLAGGGMDPAQIERLRTDGKLGFLTLQNAPVMRRLVEQHRIDTTGDLVRAGLFDAEAWKPLIGDDLPAGLTVDEYAAGLAVKVRLAHPTLVTADLVRRGEVALGADDVVPEVADFLDGAQAGEQIGAKPFQTWVRFGSLSRDAQQSVLRLERMYQISPSDAGMKVLSERQIDSARAVMRYSEAQFMNEHGSAFSDPREAKLVYRKAEQVHGMTMNVVIEYMNARRRPGANFVPLPGIELPEGTPGKAMLESLFSSLDFCACEHCNSVLSPAAYLVDLFETLDLSDVTHVLDDPLTVLFERRPDLQHLLLTCENTNVALAYVDLVNEILEHYVANGSLTNFAGHDTSEDATTADLLADPPYVEEAAYAPLESAVFPAPLPFHMPLEALRLYFQAWDTTLADALTLFGTAAETRRERLQLSPAEFAILTDHTFKSLPEHFGEDPGLTIDDLNAAISNAKTFCRRLGLAYLDLDAILETRFVNPGVEIVPLFEALHVGLDDIKRWVDGDISDQELVGLLPPDLDAAPYGGNVLAWLTAHRDALFRLVTLRPTDDADPELDDCDFKVLELRLALPDDNTNALTEAEYTKLYRFVRLWRRLGLSIADTDALLTALLPSLGIQPSLSDLDAAIATGLDRISNFRWLLHTVSVSSRDEGDWLALFDTSEPVDVQRDRLARLLRLGAVDFDSLQALTGADPFVADIGADYPSLLRFVDAWMALKSAPVKIADLDWLVRHQDPSATLAQDPATIATERRLLRDALTGVDATLGSGAGADLATTQSAMALVYDPTVVSRFFGLLDDSRTYEAPFLTAEEALPTPLTDVAPRLGFDAFTKRLTHPGTVSTAVRDALHLAADGLSLADLEETTSAADLATYVTDVKAAVDALHDAAAADRAGFAAEFPELAAVLDSAAEVPAGDRAVIVRAGVLPELRDRLKATALRTTLAAVLRADEAIVAVLASDPSVVHAALDGTKGVLDDFAALETPLLLDQNETIELLLDPMVTEDHILYVQAPAGTVVSLTVDGVVAIPSAPVAATGDISTSAPIALAVGKPVRLELTISSLPELATVALLWRTKGIAKGPIPADRLTTVASAAAADASLTRLHKAATIVQAFGLTPAELAFFAAVCPDTIGFLNELPTSPSIAPGAAVALFTKLALLLAFAAFRTDTESEADTWVGILASGALGDAAGQARAAATAGWRVQDIADAMAFLNPPAGSRGALETLASVRRLVDLAVLTNQSVADLRAWAKSSPTTADVDAVAGSMKAALDPAAWRETVQSVNDALRNKRRDALVAWILTFDPPTPAITNVNELYEHFLVDVEMDACMQTSRIRLALSTVQLFVTRCLMGLEDRVAPASINAEHWQWMRRYRVWEANRKIFLFPENWLEPELRDGKSSFFNELEGELLKSDITDELAENAFLGYLKKLDDVARLEIAGVYWEQRTPGNPKDDILHVFGRSNGRTRQYYYRRFEYGYWTPWEKVGVTIESDSVIPVMWRSQLYLFWVTALEKPRKGLQDQDQSSMANQYWKPPSPIDVELSLSWAEYFRGSWVSPKSTNMRRPLVIDGLSEFHRDDVVLAVRTEKSAGLSERLVCSVVYFHKNDVKAFKVVFTSKNSDPLVTVDDADAFLRDKVEWFNYNLFWERQSTTATLVDTSLDVPTKDLTIRVAQPANAAAANVDELVLTKTLPDAGFNVRPAMHPVENQWEAPFFYTDEHSTFLVRPDEVAYQFDDVDEYVPFPIDPIEIYVPPFIEEVVIPDPRDPIWNPPWKELVNPNVKNVLPNADTFDLDGVQFGALGLMR